MNSEGNPRLRLGIFGGSGRMGSRIRVLADGPELRSKVQIVASPGRNEALESLWSAEGIIDFSLPAASEFLAQMALNRANQNLALPFFVVGTTGHSDQALAVWKSVSEKTLVLLSANFSPGIQILLEALQTVSSLYPSLGFSPSMVDIHHIHKKDAPSGTALLLARALAPTTHETLPIESRREGEVIGTHVIHLQGPGESLSFTHSAENRDIFARGALLAALKLREMAHFKFLKPEKVLSLQDVWRADKLCR